ncbi:hypothetical protein V1517DRAFT_315719 [Lipomyces orientalis]|uniref:Uncharacterized protein n=1 Tax=Lipomyces orientalis TaxID=1233043 RepID=A0ACC3TWF5_9ASCO
MAPLNLLFTGATGYIGGEVFDHLISSNTKNQVYSITAIARKPEAVEKIRSSYPSDALTVVQAGYTDPVFATLVAEADVIVHTGESADDETSADVITKNIKDGALLVHTSGTGILINKSEFDQEVTRRYDDVADIKTITSWDLDHFHRDIDIKILNLHKIKPTVKTIIICPPLIYGTGTGKVNRMSQQIPWMIKFASILKRNGVYGSGKAIWSNVHISDLAELYVLILATYVSDPKKLWYNDDGYYFAENGSHNWKSITAACDEPLVKYGIIAPENTAKVGTPDEFHFTEEELKKELDPELYKYATSMYGTNSGSKATRARSLGWVPKQPDVYSTLDEEVKNFKEFGAPR